MPSIKQPPRRPLSNWISSVTLEPTQDFMKAHLYARANSDRGARVSRSHAL